MSKRQPRPRPPGIYRHDAEAKRMHGWTVCVSRNRRRFQRFFYDLAHGGKAAAYQAALRHRERIVRKHAPISRAAYAAILRRNNTSGVPGVSRNPAKIRGGRRGKWVAIWVPESGGKRKIATFSIPRYGEKRAFEMAVAARQEALAAMTGSWAGAGAAMKRTRRSRVASLPKPDARIARVHVGARRVMVTLRDARFVSVPLWLVPKLWKAAAAARQAVRIAADARSIEWPGLGVRITLSGLLAEAL